MADSAADGAPGAQPPPADTRRSYLVGVAMVLAGSLCLSIAGVTLRHVESASEWTILFYRSVIFAATLLIWLALRYRSRLVRAFIGIGRLGLLVAIVMGTSFVAYLISLSLTTIANAMVVLASGPVFAALLGWILLREKVRRHTWIAIAVASIGLVATVADGIGSGSFMGLVYAFFAILMFSLMIVLLRGGRDRDMLPAACLAGLVAAAISAPLVDSFALTAHDFHLALLLGVVQNAGGFVLIALGTRRVPAAQVGLLTLTEPILAPVWAWLGVGEVPTHLAIAGGLFVVVAVAYNAIAGARRRPV